MNLQTTYAEGITPPLDALLVLIGARLGICPIGVGVCDAWLTDKPPGAG